MLRVRQITLSRLSKQRFFVRKVEMTSLAQSGSQLAACDGVGVMDISVQQLRRCEMLIFTLCGKIAPTAYRVCAKSLAD